MKPQICHIYTLKQKLFIHEWLCGIPDRKTTDYDLTGEGQISLGRSDFSLDYRLRNGCVAHGSSYTRVDVTPPRMA